jgi:hypothetical protein
MGKKIKLDNIFKFIVGSFIFLSSLLTYLHDVRWSFLSMFIGLNLIQFSFTNFCPLIIILKRLGFKN